MDRLSTLPDDVICDILSFLPTKTSVRTSILSKRWKCLWTQVPALEFTEKVDSKIITKVMLQNKLNINTFHLDCHELDLSGYKFDSWIDNVTARNVRNLVLKINYQIFMLPRCLFTCKTLVYLSISGVNYCDVPVGCGVDFPVLKKLELVHVQFAYKDSLPRLLFGCPVLEELIADIRNSPNKVVCSPTITKLTIRADYGRKRKDPCKMKLDAPALRYLRLHARTFEKFSAGTLSSLNEADVNVFDRGDCGIIFCSRSILDFLGKMSNVRCLKLSTRYLMISYKVLSVWAPMFDKLTELELCGDCRFIPIFLENANSLRLLTIEPLDIWHGRWDSNGSDPEKVVPALVISFLETDTFDTWNLNWWDPKQVPACLTSHLETVTLLNFQWSSDREFDMIRYILSNGDVLKRVRITTRHCPHELDSEKKCEVLNRLASFESGSETCQVSFD